MSAGESILAERSDYRAASLRCSLEGEGRPEHEKQGRSRGKDEERQVRERHIINYILKLLITEYTAFTRALEKVTKNFCRQPRRM